MRTDPEEWRKLWTNIRELAERFEDELVFIGGVAVFLHVKEEDLPKNFIEFSHDGDFYISFSDMDELRTTDVVTKNKRLKKYQLFKDGVPFDVYLENQSGLLVRFEDVVKLSEIIDDVRVACLEHLLLLKLDAYHDRRGSAKGGKDERDIIRIAYLLHKHNGVDRSRLAPYLTEEMTELMSSIKKSPEFLIICEGNAHKARQLREAFSKMALDVALTLKE